MKIFCVLVTSFMLGLDVMHAASVTTADTYQFINLAGSELQSQVNMIPQIKAQVDEIETQLLVPVADKNKDILQSLRQAQSVMDGNSAIHDLLSTNGRFLTSLSGDKAPAAIDSMKSILRATKQELLSKQERVRTDLESTLDKFFSKINSENLPTFTAALVDSTSEAIRNASKSIKAIEQFRNQTYANNASDIDQSILFGFAPRQSKEILYLKNLLSKDFDDLKFLEQQIVPSELSTLNTSVRALIQNNLPVLQKMLEDSEAESEQYVNQTALGNGLNLDGLLNATRIDLSSQVSTQVAAINRSLSELNSTILAYSNLETRTANLLQALQTQLGAIETAKQASLTTSIFPITKGLGSAMASAVSEVASTYSKFVSDLESAKSDSKNLISQKKIRCLDQLYESI